MTSTRHRRRQPVSSNAGAILGRGDLSCTWRGGAWYQLDLSALMEVKKFAAMQLR